MDIQKINNELWEEMTQEKSRRRSGQKHCFCCGKLDMCVYWGGSHVDIGHSYGDYCKDCYFGGGREWGGLIIGPKYKYQNDFVYLYQIPKDRKKTIKFFSWPPYTEIMK